MSTFTTLVSANSLHELMQSSNPVVIDCRFSLTDTDAGFRDYVDNHIPGAVYAHLDHDMSSSIIPGVSGRHPLPNPAQWITRLRSWGVNSDTQVVVYDDGPGAIAARAWWLSRWVGHVSVAVLDGGYRAWRSNEYAVCDQVPSGNPGSITLQTPLVTCINAEQVLEKDRLLIDARDPERYSGEHEPLDPVAGHIPAALNLPFNQNLRSDKTFLSAEDLRARFEPVLRQAQSAVPAQTVTHYCGSGVTAAHNVLAMMVAKLPVPDLYAGSWSEWIQDKNRPIVGP